MMGVHDHQLMCVPPRVMHGKESVRFTLGSFRLIPVVIPCAVADGRTSAAMSQSLEDTVYFRMIHVDQLEYVASLEVNRLFVLSPSVSE